MGRKWKSHTLEEGPTRRSGCINAGNGGAVEQLERVADAITHSPTKKKPHESRAAQEQPLNSLAPVPKASQKARGKRKIEQPPPPEEFTFYNRPQHFGTYWILSSNPSTPDLDRLFKEAISGHPIFTSDPPQDDQEMGVDYQEDGITGDDGREERSGGEGMEQHHTDKEAGGIYWEALDIYSDQERVTEGDDMQEQDPSFHWPQDPKQDALSEEQQEESILVDPHTITLEGKQLARWAKAARRDIQEHVTSNVDEDEFAIAPMGD
ncbi:hypothetical protein BDR04DRAFT_1152650 [Suillus decipiens]|nr:hypothetical protein BDR04DRAFT_1152650 [Suillus decipiens]